MVQLKKIRWGIIGCGDVTEVKSGPAFQRIENSELVAVMRRDASKAADFARRHGVPKWYSSANELINDPDVNAIYVATPPAFHKQYAIAAMQAGKPVYVEKPMAMNVAECLEMNQVSAQTDVPLFVAYYRRSLPLFLKVKELIDQKAIGDVRLVNVKMYHPPLPNDSHPTQKSWRVKPEIAGAGYFFDLASHCIDILNFFFGDAILFAGEAYNQANMYEAEDIVVAALLFPNQVVGNAVWCFTASPQNRTDKVEIVGSSGSLEFSVFEQNPIQLISVERTEAFHYERIRTIQQPLIETIVQQLRGEGSCPSTGTTAIHTNRIMNQIVKNYYHA